VPEKGHGGIERSMAMDLGSVKCKGVAQERREGVESVEDMSIWKSRSFGSSRGS
jgi:hypothetical protein